MHRLFSIIVVCLNAGKKLDRTIESILGQTEADYEIIVKDGLSTDDSVERLPKNDKIKVYRQEDTGIYDAMNQAIGHAEGEYLFFLNCGDFFYDENVLAKVKEVIGKKRIQDGKSPLIFYGDIYECLTESAVQSNPVIDDFACYRNVPCHQACFYGRELFVRRGFETRYKVRGDYEHFLWCYYEAGADMVYMPFMVVCYEGGGFSESKENKKLSAKEHGEIVKKYMPHGKVLLYRLLLFLTLASLRTKIAENPATARMYNKMKHLLYDLKKDK